MTPEYSTSCVDWESRLEQGLSIIPPPIFKEPAERAWSVLSQLKLVDVAGQPTMGEASPPWIKDLCMSFFGAVDETTGQRLIREYFVLVPKKSSKSNTAAAIMVTALVIGWRHEAEYLIVAPTITAAQNSFKPAVAMIRADPRLSKLFQVSEHTRTIKHRKNRATLKVLAASGDTLVGSKASILLLDEEHAIATMRGAASLMTEAMGGLAARPEGAVLKITTQSSEPPVGIFKDDLRMYRDIRDGVIEDKGRLPILFEHPRSWIESGRAQTLEGLAITNASLGYSVSRSFLEAELKKANELGGEAKIEFHAKHNNLEVGLNLRSDRWAGADFWQQTADPTLNLDTLIERCDVAVVGIDGGGLTDLLGLTVVGRCKTTRKWLSWSTAWAHKIVLDRVKSIAGRLLDFERDGDLVMVDLPGQDVEQVCEIVQRLESAGLLPEKNAIGVDPAGITAIVDMLTGPQYNIDLSRIVGVSQGYRLSGAVKTAERALAGGTLLHADQPLMDWSVSNVKIELKGSAVYATKAASGWAKIDSVAALYNAISLIALNPSGRGTLSSYLDSFTSS